MPDEPQTMIAWVPRLARNGRSCLMPVSLPYVAQICDEPRYRTPDKLELRIGKRTGQPRYVADMSALEAWRN
jgi:hypothetical protein